MDPMRLLAAAPGDARILQAVLERGNQLRAEYDAALANAIGVETANALLPGLVKALSKTIEAIAKAMK